MSKPAPMTKKAINALLVGERAKSRAKQANSAFMRKTLNIYKGMERRAAKDGQMLDFILADFRFFFTVGIDRGCWYTGDKLRLNIATADHDIPIARGGSYSLSNLRVCSVAANFQKGIMTGAEFQNLIERCKVLLAPVACDDLSALLRAYREQQSERNLYKEAFRKSIIDRRKDQHFDNEDEEWDYWPARAQEAK